MPSSFASCHSTPCAFAPAISLSSLPFHASRTSSHQHIPSPSLRPSQRIRADARPRDPLLCSQSSESVSKSETKSETKSSSLAPNSPSVPTLFRGPEAVIGIVLAAAALLADFARSIVRLTIPPAHRIASLSTDLRDVDLSIASLQSALDASKAALSETERQLDASIARASTAEGAISAMDHTRAAIADARRQSSHVLHRLTAVRDALRHKQPPHNLPAADDLDDIRAQRDQLKAAVSARESELSDIRAKLDVAKSDGSHKASTFRQREDELKQQVTQRETELAAAADARAEIEARAADLTDRARALEEENAAASDALVETRRELQRAKTDMEQRMEEWQKADAENKRALERTEEAERLQDVVTDMEKELGALQSELRSRDQVVEDVAMESDELRSLLAARDAELQELTRRLESALGSEEPGPSPDSSKSDLSLDEVKSSLDAEQLELTAEIARAELASMELSKEDMDELVRLNLEMGAEGSLLQADLLRAESKMKKENADQVRRNEAVNEILESDERDGVDSEILEELLQSTVKEEELEREFGSSGADSFAERGIDVEEDSVPQEAGKTEAPDEGEDVVEPAMAVAKQAQRKKRGGRKKEGTKTKAAGGTEEEEGGGGWGRGRGRGRGSTT